MKAELKKKWWMTKFKGYKQLDNYCIYMDITASPFVTRHVKIRNFGGAYYKIDYSSYSRNITACKNNQIWMSEIHIHVSNWKKALKVSEELLENGYIEGMM